MMEDFFGEDCGFAESSLEEVKEHRSDQGTKYFFSVKIGEDCHIHACILKSAEAGEKLSCVSVLYPKNPSDILECF